MNYLRSEQGGAAAEYALILALLGGGLALSITGLRNAARGAITNAALQVASSDPGSGGSSGSSGSGSSGSTNSTNTTGGGDPNCPSGQYNGAGKCKP